MSTKKVYQRVTDEILKSLKEGVIPWHQAWKNNGVFPRNLTSDREYHGTNWLILSSLGFASPYFATFKQIKESGGHVKKGVHSLPIIYADKIFVDSEGNRVKQAQKEEDGIRALPYIKQFLVFNLTQTEEVPTEKIPQPIKADERPPVDKAEAIIDKFSNSQNSATIFHGCSLSSEGRVQACYILERDEITVPEKALFDSVEDYYSTLFHEMVHSTGHASRLARSLKGRDKINEYAFEELVAEIGSAYLSARCGIAPATIENSVSYISNWLKRFKSDSSYIVKASAAAQRAVDLIIG